MKRLGRYNDKILKQFVAQTRIWDNQLNTEWVARNYLASKMILSASLMLSSAAYANDSNLKIVEPYLLYYSLLSCCRAVVLTSPSQQWREGNIFHGTHQAIINAATTSLNGLGKKFADDINTLMLKAKDYREMFSYKFPLTGIPNLPEELSVELTEVIGVATVLVEVAQFNSEKLAEAFRKNCIERSFEVDDDTLNRCLVYETKNMSFVDFDDAYRISKIVRKKNRPCSLDTTMDAGMVDDFFGAWTSPKEAGAFDPDFDCRIIYDFP